MRDRDEAARANEKLWDAEVARGCGYTTPWLDLDMDLVRACAEDDARVLPEPLTCMEPSSFLADVEGMDVLCLGAGGGQQSAVFGLLGARVTVVDLSGGQLEGDRRAAEHHGLEIRTVHADMRDLSALEDRSFDLVYATGTCYVPDVRAVHAETARVLRPGGLYRLDARQPAVFEVSWDGTGYRIERPYRERTLRRDDGGLEFRHDQEDLFNGVLDAGFSIERVHESPWGRRPESAHEPGSWDHERDFVAGEFVIVARRSGRPPC